MNVAKLGKVALVFVQNTSQSQTNITTTQEGVGSFSALADKSSLVNQGLQKSTSVTNDTNISKKDLKDLIQKLNDSISTLNDSVKFSYSEDIKALVVKVIDSKTGQVIRQVPPEELIKLEAHFSQSRGILFNKEVK